MLQAALAVALSFEHPEPSLVRTAHLRFIAGRGLEFAGERVYFGNLHSHTSYSDGSGTPENAFAHARDIAHLDFLAVTEHNHEDAENGAGDRADGLLIATDHDLYNGTDEASLTNQAAAFTDDGSFVALYGQEFSSISSGNHVNVFDAPKVITTPNGDFKKLVDWIKANKDSSGKTCIVQLNHPDAFNDDAKIYGRDDFGTKANWISKMDGVASLIEMSVGPAFAQAFTSNKPSPAESDFFKFLSLGFHVSPTGNQDNHYVTWGSATNVRTGVYARALTKKGILDALRTGRSYATEDKNLKAMLWVEGVLAGGTTAFPGASTDVTIDLSIEDPDEPGASYEFEVYVGFKGGEASRLIAEAEWDGDTEPDTVATIEGVRVPNGADYLVVKVLQGTGSNRDRAWLAPVWFN